MILPLLECRCAGRRLRRYTRAMGDMGKAHGIEFACPLTIVPSWCISGDLVEPGCEKRAGRESERYTVNIDIDPRPRSYRTGVRGSSRLAAVTGCGEKIGCGAEFDMQPVAEAFTSRRSKLRRKQVGPAEETMAALRQLNGLLAGTTRIGEVG